MEPSSWAQLQVGTLNEIFRVRNVLNKCVCLVKMSKNEIIFSPEIQILSILNNLITLPIFIVMLNEVITDVKLMELIVMINA